VLLLDNVELTGGFFDISDLDHYLKASSSLLQES